LWGKDFIIYHTFETNFSEHNKIWGAQKDLGVTAPECPTVSAGLGRPLQESLPLAAFMFVKGV